MDFATLFDVKARYNVLICNQCQYAVPPAHIQRYLKDRYKRLTVRQRQSILAEVRTDDQLAQSQHQVTYPESQEPPVDVLPVYFDGLRCNAKDLQSQDCRYICQTPRRM